MGADAFDGVAVVAAEEDAEVDELGAGGKYICIWDGRVRRVREGGWCG